MVDRQGAAADYTQTPGRAIEWDGPVAHVRLALDEPAMARSEFHAEPIPERGWITELNPFLMLFVGLIVGAAIGFVARPLLMPEQPTVALNAGSETPVVETATPVPGAAQVEPPTPDPEEVQARLDAVMAQLVDDTRHFRGEPDAPVTIIEFSDFQ